LLWIRTRNFKNITKFKISFGKGFTLDIRAQNYLINIDQVYFKNYCSINIRQSGRLHIDKGVTFNSFCTINCLEKISIGQNTIFGINVHIFDHNHAYKNQEKLIKKQGYNTSSITIGENCWIGANVVILKGVNIGDNVIIGAGVVVHKSIPCNTVIYNNQDTRSLKL